MNKKKEIQNYFRMKVDSSFNRLNADLIVTYDSIQSYLNLQIEKTNTIQDSLSGSFMSVSNNILAVDEALIGLRDIVDSLETSVDKTVKNTELFSNSLKYRMDSLQKGIRSLNSPLNWIGIDVQFEVEFDSSIVERFDNDYKLDRYYRITLDTSDIKMDFPFETEEFEWYEEYRDRWFSEFRYSRISFSFEMKDADNNIIGEGKSGSEFQSMYSLGYTGSGIFCRIYFLIDLSKFDRINYLSDLNQCNLFLSPWIVPDSDNIQNEFFRSYGSLGGRPYISTIDSKRHNFVMQSLSVDNGFTSLFKDALFGGSNLVHFPDSLFYGKEVERDYSLKRRIQEVIYN